MEEYLKLLGMKARDRVTGMEGVICSVCFDLYGCVQVILNPGIDKDGKPLDQHWFDHKRMAIIGKKPVMEPARFVAPGKEQGPAERPAGFANA